MSFLHRIVILFKKNCIIKEDTNTLRNNKTNCLLKLIFKFIDLSHEIGTIQLLYYVIIIHHFLVFNTGQLTLLCEKKCNGNVLVKTVNTFISMMLYIFIKR